MNKTLREKRGVVLLYTMHSRPTPPVDTHPMGVPRKKERKDVVRKRTNPSKFGF
jgi:hypothetical protein